MDVLLKHEVTHIINLATGVQNSFPEKFTYKNIEVRDLPNSNIMQHFEECNYFIDDVRKSSGRVLVHCNAGVSRAASVTIAYVMNHCKMSYNEAFDMLKSKRSCIQPNIGFTTQLKEYEQVIGASSKH